jgi:hypothetical protein
MSALSSLLDFVAAVLSGGRAIISIPGLSVAWPFRPWP